MSSFTSALEPSKQAIDNPHRKILKEEAPETRVGDEGSAKRNIERRHNGGSVSVRKEKSVGAPIDDGSTYQDGAALDKEDPNYDSEEETGYEYIPSKYDYNIREDIAKSKMTLSSFKKAIEKIISEYFVSEDLEDFVHSVTELDCPAYSYELVKRAINMALDKLDRERELVSRLISACYPDILSSSMIGKGFERLFELVDEIEKDVPNARDMISTFIARCVVDEVLPPSFLGDPIICNLGGEIIDYAKNMLSRDHAGARLEKVWGPGDGRPVEELKIAIDQLLLEYLLSAQLEEAGRCIKQLQSPQFHYEIVKRAIVLSLEKSSADRAAMSSLFTGLVEMDLLSLQQIKKGFDKVASIMSDLVLDVPTAPALLREFVDRGITDGVLASDYTIPAALPVSETL